MKSTQAFQVAAQFTLFAAVAAALLPIAASAQILVVTRNVNLRRDPSSAHPPIVSLRPPDELEALDTAVVDGYYHVRTEEGDSGWVWSRNVRLLDARPDLESDTIADSIDSSWAKPAAQSGWFKSHGDSCGPSGDGGDTATNRRKNRIDVPGRYHSVSFDAIAALLYPRPAPRDRGQWSGDQLGAIGQYEGVALTVIGYLVAIKPQRSGTGESTNCHWRAASEVDWHVALVKKPGRGEEDAVVVETTPRLRRGHARWTEGRLAPWVDSGNPVRISGWLMFDPQHANHLGRYRSTLWEIHPITKIEVWRNGEWVDLDQLP